MTSARQWLQRQLLRANRPTLDIALLTNRGAYYVMSRVALLAVRALMRTGLHAAELYLLTGEFPFQFLVPLLAMRAIPGLFSGVHWGALEVLRAYVRQEVAGRRPERARAFTEAWLVLGGGGGVVMLTAVYCFTSMQTEVETETLGLYGSFAIACAIAITVDLWTRTYHAGVFATGRVHRSAWSIFAPDLADLVVLFVLFPRIGPFALHSVVLVGAALRGALATYYARRAYKVRRLTRPHPFRLAALNRITPRALLETGKQAFATLPLQLDRALLLTLLAVPTPGSDMPIAVPYYAMRPVLAFAHAWPRAFYPDLVRLDAAALGVLRRRFERLLERTAIGAGLSSAGLVTLLAFLGTGSDGLSAAAWLVPLSAVRSQFALKQLRAFVYGAHLHLILVSAVLLVGLVVAPLARLSDRAAVLALTILLAVALLIAGRVRNRAAHRRDIHKRRLPVAAWLANVGAFRHPMRLTIALVDQDIARSGSLIAEIGRKIENGHVTRCGRAWLLWWEPADSAKSRVELARIFGGVVSRIEMVHGADGLSTLREALARSVLPPPLSAALKRKSTTDSKSELNLLAQAVAPRALVIDFNGSGATIPRLTAKQLILVRRAALAAAREQHIVPRWAEWQAATYAPHGEIEVIYLWPKEAAGARALREFALAASWRDSVPDVSR